MKFPDGFTKLDILIYIANIILTVISFVLVIMQLTGIRDTFIIYVGLFSITSFMQAYITSTDDKSYKRNMLFGGFFALALLLF